MDWKIYTRGDIGSYMSCFYGWLEIFDGFLK